MYSEPQFRVEAYSPLVIFQLNVLWVRGQGARPYSFKYRNSPIGKPEILRRTPYLTIIHLTPNPFIKIRTVLEIILNTAVRATKNSVECFYQTRPFMILTCSIFS